MIHITKTKRWKSWKNKITEEEYRRSFIDNGIRTTPKQRKLDWLSRKTNKPKAYWSKLTSRQLGKIIFNQNNIDKIKL